MERQSQGAWLVHHTQKLQHITNQNGYQQTFLAGKAGVLLSVIASDSQWSVDRSRLEALAVAANINTTFELPRLLEVLEKQRLIDRSETAIEVLGVTTPMTLAHTADIFATLAPPPRELAALDLAERASLAPVLATAVAEELGDTYRMSRSEVDGLLHDAEQIGFTDTERFGRGEKLLFNGNLFRRGTAAKVKSVLDSFSPDDQARLLELNELMKRRGCVETTEAERIAGPVLYQKITAVGLVDLSVVSNSGEEVGYLTTPSAFSKYGSTSMIDDAFDLAKAFVSSITYGMTKSGHARGQIRMVEKLLGSLIKGNEVGPVDAIGEDYKVLELKGVVRVRSGTKSGRTGPMLKLLKKEVGELALQVITKGDVSEHSLTSLPGGFVTAFAGPEQNRERARRAQVSSSPKATHDILFVLRTGGAR